MASKSARKRRKRRPPPGPPATGPPAGQDAEAASTAAVRSSTPRRQRAGTPGPPPAPWGSFPLVELSVLLGIVMLIVGFFFVDGSRAPILIAAGLILGSIGGLELSIREHFAGYQSHTLVLSGVPALIVLGALFYAGPDELPRIARGAIGVLVFVVAAVLLTRAFSRRSGGQRFSFRPLRSRER